ncbi:hypothetical protein EJD97_011189, partial [Solanum chilense]
MKFNYMIILTGSSKLLYVNKSKNDNLDLLLFDFATILAATNNFSLSNKLGEGDFGHVYKVALKDGQEKAVKRLSRYSAQGTDEFKNEVIFIAKLQHRDLVKLQAEEKMLVNEYMPNNSSYWFLFDTDRRSLLDWPKCFHIINGIARGLLYLHQDSRLRIIHRDLKPRNDLLDINMNPKLSEFGMARSFGGNEIGVMKTRVVSIHFKEGRVMDVINTHLKKLCNNHCEVQRSVHIGLLCVQQCLEDRPSMSSVVLMLS